MMAAKLRNPPMLGGASAQINPKPGIANGVSKRHLDVIAPD